jgi:hypothetical protein
MGEPKTLARAGGSRPDLAFSSIHTRSQLSLTGKRPIEVMSERATEAFCMRA